MILRDHIKAAIKGDIRSFEYLVNNFQGYVISYAYGILRDYHSAEDAAQETFIQMYGSIGNLKEPSSFLSWLKKMTFFSCSRMTRRKEPEMHDDFRESSDRNNPADKAEMDERMSLINYSLGRLTEVQREAISLHYLMDKSYAEIAELLGVAEAAVTNRLYSGRKKLKDIMLITMKEYVEEIMSNREQFTKKVLDKVFGFSIEVPDGWNAFPPIRGDLPMIIRYESNEDGFHKLVIFRDAFDPKITDEYTIEMNNKVLSNEGCTNINHGWLNTESGKILYIDYEYDHEHKYYLAYNRMYFVKKHKLIFCLNFNSTDKTGKIDLFDSIVKSFKIIDERKENQNQITKVDNIELLSFKSDDDTFMIDVPVNWTRRPAQEQNEIVIFLSRENGIHVLTVYRYPCKPEYSYKNIFDQTRLIKEKYGYNNFVTTEEKIGEKNIHIFKISSDIDSCRHFHIEYNNVIYVLKFGSAMKSEMFPVYEHIVKNFKVLIDKYPDESDNCSDNTDVKHIKNEKWNYSIDIPGYWNSVLPETRLDNPYEVSRYLLNDNQGKGLLTISRIPNNPENTSKEIFENNKKMISKQVYENIQETEMKMESGTVLLLDCEKTIDNSRWKWYFYLVPSGTLLYQLGFGAPVSDFMNDEYEKIVNSFRVLDKK